jgi:hypothetical protein
MSDNFGISQEIYNVLNEKTHSVDTEKLIQTKYNVDSIEELLYSERDYFLTNKANQDPFTHFSPRLVNKNDACNYLHYLKKSDLDATKYGLVENNVFINEDLSSEQINATVDAIKKTNSMHTNNYDGGKAAVYLQYYNGALNNLRDSDSSSLKNCFIFDAKVMLMSIITDILAHNVNTWKMIYWTPYWSYGDIGDNTIIMENVDKDTTLENRILIISSFLEKIRESWKKFTIINRDGTNELVVSWTISANFNDGLIKVTNLQGYQFLYKLGSPASGSRYRNKYLKYKTKYLLLKKKVK